MFSQIPQANPLANYLAHKNEVDGAIKSMLEKGQYINGKEIELFEKEFASYIGVKNAIGVGSGTDAIYIALKACGIGSGDEVITVSHTAVATVAAIELAGATPILIDIDPMTYTMSSDCLERAIEKLRGGRRIKAVVPVHLYGCPCDMKSISEVARRYRLFIIEDCAQSHGASIDGCKTGAWGDMSAFSFYPTKNLGAIGDGGMVVSNDAKLAEKARILKEYGWRKRFISDIPGINSRLDEIQAAILRVKLQYLDDDNKRRRKIANRYDRALSASSVIIPKIKNGFEHVYHQYVIRTKNRDKVQAFLKGQKVGTSIHYPLPIHLQPAYKKRIAVSEKLKQTEAIYKEILSLPIYPQLSNKHVDYVSKLIVDVSR